MYSILFIPNNSLTNITNELAFDVIKSSMLSNGFEWVDGYLFFGNSFINAVDCVLIIQKISRENFWFSDFIKDIRLLRIEENCSLVPAINLE